MGLTIEWIMGIARAGKDHNTYGDSYEVSCVILKDAKTATVKGASGNTLTREVVDDLKAQLFSLGVTKIKWVRKNGKEITISG